MFKKKRMIILGVVALALVSVGVAFAMGLLNLPPFPVFAVHGPWAAGTMGSTIDITLSGVGSGYDVMDGTYAGWCAEDNHMPNAPPGDVTLYDSTDMGIPWDMVNWALNNREGYSIQEVQVAIWLLTGTYDGTFPSAYPGGLALYNAAMANGGGFVPQPGDVIAVIVEIDGIGPGGYQDTIIEVPLPPDDGGEGCTPGYWRNHHEDWPPTGYTTGDDFDTTFGVDNFDPDINLGKAIKLGGGGVKKLARHGTAALLSAAHPDVNYPYTVAEVIAFVQAGDAETLVIANELGCTIP
jgi:hypothetical protein